MELWLPAVLPAVTVAVYAGDSGDATTNTGPGTYLPNSKQSPLAPTFADVSYGEHERNKLDFWQAESEVPTPVAVRYAYTNRPLGVYLYNEAGLPASPFATETEQNDTKSSETDSAVIP